MQTIKQASNGSKKEVFYMKRSFHLLFFIIRLPHPNSGTPHAQVAPPLQSGSEGSELLESASAVHAATEAPPTDGGFLDDNRQTDSKQKGSVCRFKHPPGGEKMQI